MSSRAGISETVAQAKLSIVNLVATAELDQSVNLEHLVNVHGFLYDYEIYHCAYLKDRRTKGKVSIFSSGKMICIGAKSLEAAKHDLNYAAKRLAELGLISRTRIRAKLQNIVATADLGKSLDLESIASKLPHAIYEPEQFPGAVYWAPELDGAAMLLFPTGKIVVAGIKRQESLPVAEKLLEGLILRAQKFDGRKSYA